MKVRAGLKVLLFQRLELWLADPRPRNGPQGRRERPRGRARARLGPHEAALHGRGTTHRRSSLGRRPLGHQRIVRATGQRWRRSDHRLINTRRSSTLTIALSPHCSSPHSAQKTRRNTTTAVPRAAHRSRASTSKTFSLPEIRSKKT